jgi:hypothetical protein
MEILPIEKREAIYEDIHIILKSIANRSELLEQAWYFILRKYLCPLDIIRKMEIHR